MKTRTWPLQDRVKGMVFIADRRESTARSIWKRPEQKEKVADQIWPAEQRRGGKEMRGEPRAEDQKE